MISKIIEFDILDTAWLQILRLHPDIELNAEGGALELKRNYKLDHPINMEAIKEREQCITTFMECDGYLFTASVDGNLKISGVEDDVAIIDENLINSHIDEEAAESSVWTSYSHLNIDCIRNIQSRYSDNTETCMRVAVYHLVATKPEAGDPKKVPVTDVPRVISYRVIVVDLVLLKDQRTVEVDDDGNCIPQEVPPQFTFNVVHELFVDKFVEDQTDTWKNSPGDFINIDMSLDGKFFSVVTRGPEGCCKIYQLGAVNTTPPVVVKRINEGEDGEEGNGEGAAENVPDNAPVDPTILAILEQNSGVLDGLTIKSVILVVSDEPTSKHVHNEKPSPPTTGDTDETKTAPSVELEGEFSFLCFPEEAKCWFTLGLQKIVVEEEIVDEKAAGKKDDKKGKGAVEVEEPDPFLYSVFQKSVFNLCSGLTCYKLDHQRNIMVIGQHDGSVNLFSLADLSLVSTVANHQRPVTSLWLFCQQDKGVFYLVSGSANGTLCFYSCQGQIKSDFESNFAKSLFSLQLIDYRFDVNDCHVVQIQGPAKHNTMSPFVYVQYSTGSIAVYDYTKAALVGSVNSTMRKGFEFIQLKTLSYDSIRAFAAKPIDADTIESQSQVPSTEEPVETPAFPSSLPSDAEILSSVHLQRSISMVLGRKFACLYQQADQSLLLCEYIPTTSIPPQPMSVMDPLKTTAKISIYHNSIEPLQLLKKHTAKSRSERISRKTKLAKSMKEFFNVM